MDRKNLMRNGSRALFPSRVETRNHENDRHASPRYQGKVSTSSVGGSSLDFSTRNKRSGSQVKKKGLVDANIPPNHYR